MILSKLETVPGKQITKFFGVVLARQDAIARMVREAESLGANAAVNVRFSTSSVAQGAAELFAYGTAVKVE